MGYVLEQVQRGKKKLQIINIDLKENKKCITFKLCC